QVRLSENGDGAAVFEADLDVVLAARGRSDVAGEPRADGSSWRHRLAGEVREGGSDEQVERDHARDRVAGQAEHRFPVAHGQDRGLAGFERDAVDENAWLAK